MDDGTHEIVFNIITCFVGHKNVALGKARGSLHVKAPGIVQADWVIETCQ